MASGKAFPSLVPTLLLVAGWPSVRPQSSLGVPVRNLDSEGHAGLEGPTHINRNSLSASDSGILRNLSKSDTVSNESGTGPATPQADRKSLLPSFCVGDCIDRVSCKESISTTLTELEVPKDRELQRRRRE